MLAEEERNIYLAVEGNLLSFVSAYEYLRAQMTQILCAVGMHNAILRNHLKQIIIRFLYFISISSSLCLSPGWEHCVVFLGETLHSNSASDSDPLRCINR